MEISEAIEKATLRIEQRKLARKLARMKKQKSKARKKKYGKQKLHTKNKSLLRLVKNKWFSKSAELLKDQDLITGIKFLESRGKHFYLCEGRGWAVYFCSDGKFQMQRWGMYVIKEFIRPITRANVYFIEEEDIKKVAEMDFKEELKKQILQR